MFAPAAQRQSAAVKVTDESSDALLDTILGDLGGNEPPSRIGASLPQVTKTFERPSGRGLGAAGTRAQPGPGGRSGLLGSSSSGRQATSAVAAAPARKQAGFTKPSATARSAVHIKPEPSAYDDNGDNGCDYGNDDYDVGADIQQQDEGVRQQQQQSHDDFSFDDPGTEGIPNVLGKGMPCNDGLLQAEHCISCFGLPAVVWFPKLHCAHLESVKTAILW